MSETEAFAVIRRHQTKAPVKVIAVARELGLEVYADETLPDHVSGLLTKDEDGYFIVVNKNHHVHRQRFTIAHEIAHFVLHRHEIGDGIEDSALYRSHLLSKQETQANRLAAEILMPWTLISDLLQEDSNATIKSLAQRLKVSRSAMAIRLGVPAEDE